MSGLGLMLRGASLWSLAWSLVVNARAGQVSLWSCSILVLSVAFVTLAWTGELDK